MILLLIIALQWRHNGHDSITNHKPHHCILYRLFRRRSKKTSKLRVTGLCVGNSPETGEFTAQMTSNAENVSTWWRHHMKTRSGPVLVVTDICSNNVGNVYSDRVLLGRGWTTFHNLWLMHLYVVTTWLILIISTPRVKFLCQHRIWNINNLIFAAYFGGFYILLCLNWFVHGSRWY